MNNINESEVYRWFDLFKDNNQLTEVRIIGNNKVFSGYFKDARTLVENIKQYSDYNIYFTINSVKEECYGREQCNKIIQKPKNTTTDAEIEGRDWVFLDFDAKKIAGVNSTDEEVEYTKKKANQVYKFLIENGFNKPIVVFSGNGVHFYLKCALKASEENNNIVKRFTMAIAMLYSDDHVDIDQKIFNLGRISKIPGTISRKGSGNNKERPQRHCYITKVPDVIKINDIEYFKKIADLYPEDEIAPSSKNNYSTEKFDLDSFISKHNIRVTSTEKVADGTKYYLEHCLFNEQHKGKDAILFQRNNGAISYYCYHNSCSMNNWQKVRLMYEPDAYNKKDFSDRFKRPYQPKKEFIPIVQTEENGNTWLKMSDIEEPKLDINDYIPSGIKQIDDLIIGFKRKHVTVWSGYRGCAKSTLLNLIVLNSANMGYKSAMWTGELANDELKRWMYLQASGKAYNKQSDNHNFYYTPRNISLKIDKWIDNYFWLFNNKYGDNFKQIENSIRKLKEKEDLDTVILDNLMTLDVEDIDGDKNDKQKNLMKMLCKLAKDLNIHIHIVAHPNKSGTFLRPNNISGTGHIPDLAQNVFILHRVNQDFEVNSRDFLSKRQVFEISESRCTNCIEICKCRDKGSATDKFIKLYFELESNRLKNSIEEHIIYGWQEQPVQSEITFEHNVNSFIEPNESFFDESDDDKAPF